MRSNIVKTGALAFCVLASGCSFQELAANQTVGVLAVGAKAFFEEPDYEIAGAAMPANLKTMEALGVLADENAQLNQILAQSYCSYAFGWLEPEYIADTRSELDEGRVAMAERIRSIFARGTEYGFRGLELRHDEFEGSRQNLDQMKVALQELEEDDLPYLIWATYCWMSELQYADMIVAAADSAFIRLMLDRSRELDAGYYYSMANILLGSLEAYIPAEMGGNPERATELFEEAMQNADRKYLNAQAAYAQYVAVNTLDRELFDQLLNEVLEADTYILPAENLANQIAKKRAEALMSKADDLF